jgi:hypothetical protein
MTLDFGATGQASTGREPDASRNKKGSEEPFSPR